MSGFCVFGMTRELARRLAEQAVDRRPPPKGGWNSATWELEVSKKQQQICSEAKPRQISPKFDAPAFAEEWIEVARRTNQLIAGRVMVRGKKIDKKGGEVINKRTGAPSETWVPYQSV